MTVMNEMICDVMEYYGVEAVFEMMVIVWEWMDVNDGVVKGMTNVMPSKITAL